MQSTSRQSWISQRPNFFIRPIGFICNFIPNSYWSFHRTFHSWILSGWRILRGKIQPYEVLVRFSDTFDWRLPLRSVKRWFACVINSICQRWGHETRVWQSEHSMKKRIQELRFSMSFGNVNLPISKSSSKPNVPSRKELSRSPTTHRTPQRHQHIIQSNSGRFIHSIDPPKPTNTIKFRLDTKIRNRNSHHERINFPYPFFVLSVTVEQCVPTCRCILFGSILQFHNIG